MTALFVPCGTGLALAMAMHYCASQGYYKEQRASVVECGLKTTPNMISVS